MKLGFGNTLRRMIGSDTLRMPPHPPFTHETMVIEHLRRESEERLRNRDWARRFHR
ncbi:MAG: hypothetical protein AAF390_03570 [Pseudomonadota bacterium]